MPEPAGHDEGQTAAEEKSSPASFGLYPWIFSALLVLYLLALGPAVKMVRIHPSARPLLLPIYGPLELFARKVPPLYRALDWYVKLWTK